MRSLLLAACCLALGACAARVDQVALSPCPPSVLPVCHAGASGCEAPPFCYRTLGVVDCYYLPEAARNTAEEIVGPSACALAAQRTVLRAG